MAKLRKQAQHRAQNKTKQLRRVWQEVDAHLDLSPWISDSSWN